MNKLDASLNFQQTALRIRNQRQEILASNIANADTPQYKARDIDFASTMAAALKESGTQTGNSTSTGGLRTTSDLHLGGNGSTGLGGSNAPLFRPVIQGAVDGNTVDMDVERNAYVDNAVRYEASLNMITGQIKKMLTAITGQ